MESGGSRGGFFGRKSRRRKPMDGSGKLGEGGGENWKKHGWENIREWMRRESESERVLIWGRSRGREAEAEAEAEVEEEV